MTKADLKIKISDEIPYLRRYARALVGDQKRGDDFAIHTLEAILSDETAVIRPTSVKVDLFRTFHAIWMKTDRQPHVDGEGPLSKALQRLAQLTPNSREALLLNSIEKFTVSEIAVIMGSPEFLVKALLKTARTDMNKALTGWVMIIEDEQLIAKDLSTLVEGLGHSVTGVAPNYNEALTLGAKSMPDLILADVQLADETSGIEAVQTLHDRYGDIPVIYITAFPELLLTGKRPEPVFLIAKPYKEDQVQSAISQAMFFRTSQSKPAS